MPISRRRRNIPITSEMPRPMLPSFWSCRIQSGTRVRRNRNTPISVNLPDRLDLVVTPALAYDRAQRLHVQQFPWQQQQQHFHAQPPQY